MKDVEKLIKLLEKVSDKKVKLKEEVSEEKPLKENLSVEQKERMEGVAPKRYLNNTKIFLRLLTSEWLGEGFEKEDIKEYINELIDNI